MTNGTSGTFWTSQKYIQMTKVHYKSTLNVPFGIHLLIVQDLNWALLASVGICYKRWFARFALLYTWCDQRLHQVNTGTKSYELVTRTRTNFSQTIYLLGFAPSIGILKWSTKSTIDGGGPIMVDHITEGVFSLCVLCLMIMKMEHKHIRYVIDWNSKKGD